MLVVDKDEFNKFVNLLPDLINDECYFLSLSARTKYLSSEDRLTYSLGRTEMFSREISRDKEGLYYIMTKLEASLQYRRTNNGLAIPEKALVVYMNINPSSTVKAMMMFQQEMNKEFQQVYASMCNGKETNYEAFKRIPAKLMNSIQQARSRKIFIDIDCDTDSIDVANKIIDPLQSFGVTHWVIQTKSGYHILIKKDTLVKDCRLHEYVAEANSMCKEVTFNKNEMIPVPGTMQAGHLVRIIRSF